VRTVSVEVAWGDIAKAQGDIFVVGHYEGVVPQAAELALDKAVSGISGHDYNDTRLVITDMTTRGSLRGSLGDVVFVPLPKGKLVAVAGMGSPGRFQETELRRLWRSVVRTIGRLPRKPAISSVLVGSGVGNLLLNKCVLNMLTGIGDAIEDDPALQIGRVRIVEWSLDRALEVLRLLQELSPNACDVVKFRVRSTLVTDRGGGIPANFGYSMMLAALARSAGLSRRSPVRVALESLMKALPRRVSRESLTREFKLRTERSRQLRELALEFRVSSAARGERHSVIAPDRLTYSFDGSRVRCTAITDLVTVTERALGGPIALIDRSIKAFNGLPMDKKAHETTTLQGVRLFESLVHRDLEPIIETERPLVIEVDRTMASVPWEALRERATSVRPLGVRRQVARQLRTMYSGSVSGSAVQQLRKALVIADPHTPDGMPGVDFREEALKVVAVLETCGMEVQSRIGPAFVDGGPGPIKGVPPADITEAIADLLSGEFQIVHYCGHALFDAERPDRTGWVFAGGVLSGEYLEQMRRAPLLVVANACQTTRLSEVVARPARTRPQVRSSDSARMPRDATLVAGLADQFFKQGVADYIGTGWEVSSKPAALFASEFYGAFLGRNGCTLGEAVMRARAALYRKRNIAQYAAAWPAYQHYGNPSRTYTLRGRQPNRPSPERN